MPRQQQRDESSDLLSRYLQEIARIPRLTLEQEKELGRRVQQNDKGALEELVEANLRFVVMYAKRYRNSHVLFLDLINEGNIGLMHAAKKFDPDKNVKFITYAVWWIRQSILHALSEQGGAFRLPPKRANLMYRLEKSIAAALREGNSVPTAEELAEELGVTVKEVQTLIQANTDNFSLNAEVSDDSHTELSELIEQTSVRSAEDTLSEQSQKTEILSQMQELTPKERLVLTLRHGVTDNLPRRIDHVAEFLNRTVEDITAMIEGATEKLCKSLEVSRVELAELLLHTNPHPKAWVTWASLPDAGDFPLPRVRDNPRLRLLTQRGRAQEELEKLSLIEKTVVKLRYGILQDDELTLRDIGDILSLSRERVRQIEARAENKCRRSAKKKK